MGKKYIVELESGTHIFVLGPEGIVHIGEPDVVYETVDGMQIGDAVINAKPYTEPDLEQVRKEAYAEGFKDGQYAKRNGLVAKYAYEEGYKTAKIQCGIQAEKDMREVGERHYQRGLSDAWEAVKKLARMDTDTSESITGYFGLHNIMHNLTASEAIEKIRQYEQRQEEQIQVGDEVIPRETEYDTMIVTRLWKDDYDSDCIDAIGFDGRISSFLVSRVSKTGKHYEIAAVLEKMRGKQDG